MNFEQTAARRIGGEEGDGSENSGKKQRQLFHNTFVWLLGDNYTRLFPCASANFHGLPMLRLALASSILTLCEYLGLVHDPFPAFREVEISGAGLGRVYGS
jgi:hypothetical protein